MRNETQGVSDGRAEAEGIVGFAPACWFPSLLCYAALFLLAGPVRALPPAGQLAAQAPRANPTVIGLAVKAARCSLRAGGSLPSRLAVIDYSRPSTEPRLWVFDLRRGRLLFEERVAHGIGTGENMAVRFSNRLGSRRTSLGLFRTADTYVGSNGYSLRLHGLEPGVNDRAYERAIVMHGAPYVSGEAIAKLGHLGRSWGCPAVRPAVAHRLIDEIREGQLIFSYYPDRNWIGSSPFLRCNMPRTVPARVRSYVRSVAVGKSTSLRRPSLRSRHRWYAQNR